MAPAFAGKIAILDRRAPSQSFLSRIDWFHFPRGAARSFFHPVGDSTSTDALPPLQYILEANNLLLLETPAPKKESWKTYETGNEICSELGIPHKIELWAIFQKNWLSSVEQKHVEWICDLI